MIITSLGHAGFMVETEHAILIADPWLSAGGAFDASWFQLPCNHHLASFVDEKLAAPKAKFVYISHEHEDHYDRAFLDALRNRDFSLVIPKYRRPALRRVLADYRCTQMLAVNDGESIRFPGGELKLYLDDSELNRDSAILIRAEGETFLNLNDCRIFDRLRTIQEQEGIIDVFTCQFSGASWHPTCYEYAPDAAERIAERKVVSKFRMVERAVQQLKPRYYLPSAGPVCFLDPELFALNGIASGIFRKAPELLSHIAPLLEQTGTKWREMMPGDTLSVGSGEVEYAPGERYHEAQFASYVRTYAARYRAFFEARRRVAEMVDANHVLDKLEEALKKKLSLLPLRDRVDVPLYFGLDELAGTWLRIDFRQGAIRREASIDDETFYSIKAHAWQIDKVLSGRLTWENFGLSFRVQLHRNPDVYQPLIHAFLTMENGDLYRFCRMMTEIESRTDRIEVTAGGKTYSVNRYCPHNGGDMKEAWIEDERYLVCARHRWCFDLQNGGACTTNASSLFAEEVESPAAVESITA